ncbi:CBS domain-containing protein [Arenibaculum sp.]|jgi:CBS domain-containing protein|uniref:CBS domain-containing protein n=1 Tax=Arenibaculum sp. TaxID=2865862 RepID=UPI002E0EB1F5|nr:CBS domain-containing protein [Arenibaculum sp.]
MHVAAVLKRKGSHVVSTDPGRTVGDIVEMLADNRIGAVLVLDGGRVVGIVSERDVIRGIAEHGPAVLGHRVDTLMTRDVLHCRPTDTMAELMAVMTERRVRHLPVIADGEVAGMVSIGDVVKQRLDEAELEVETLRSYVAGNG